jgi:hypothetical protein
VSVFATLAPIVLIVGTGAALRRFGFAGEEFFRQANRLVYWVGLPALLFYKSATAGLPGPAAGRLLVLLGTGLLVTLAMAYASALFVKIPPARLGAVVQGAYRGNLAYIGLPVILFAMPDPTWSALAVVALAPAIPVYNITAVLVLMAGGRAARHPPMRRARLFVSSVLSNPLVLSTVAGIAVAMMGLPLPTWLTRTMAAFGDMTLPLALLGIGAALSLRELKGQWGWCWFSSLVKVAAAPLAGIWLGRALGWPAEEIRLAGIFLACPTAVAAYVMARQFGSDEHLTAGIIVLSTILALPALAIVLWATA